MSISWFNQQQLNEIDKTCPGSKREALEEKAKKKCRVSGDEEWRAIVDASEIDRKQIFASIVDTNSVQLGKLGKNNFFS